MNFFSGGVILKPSFCQVGAQLQVITGQPEGYGTPGIASGEGYAGTMAPRHSHPNEQITWLMRGRLATAIGEEPETIVEAGQIMVIPAGVEHETRYLTDCEIVEFFSPPRTDMFPTASPANPYATGS